MRRRRTRRRKGWKEREGKKKTERNLNQEPRGSAHVSFNSHMMMEGFSFFLFPFFPPNSSSLLKSLPCVLVSLCGNATRNTGDCSAGSPAVLAAWWLCAWDQDHGCAGLQSATVGTLAIKIHPASGTANIPDRGPNPAESPLKHTHTHSTCSLSHTHTFANLHVCTHEHTSHTPPFKSSQTSTQSFLSSGLILTSPPSINTHMHTTPTLSLYIHRFYHF